MAFGGWESETKVQLQRRLMDLEMERRAALEAANTPIIENEKKETMTSEQENINHCFVDLADNNDIEKITFAVNKAVIDVKRSKTTNNTFNNYLTSTRKTAKTCEMIDEAITKVRIDQPHVNATFETYDNVLRVTLYY